MNFGHGLVPVGADPRDPRDRSNPRLLFWRPPEGGLELRFEVKGREYWLALAEENQFYVFRETGKGIDRIPVYIDDARYEEKGSALD